MVPFGGFEMPIQYTGIEDEHNAVRHACGVFDVSHMGEVRITGEDTEAYVQHIFTNDVKDAPVGKIFYGMMLYEMEERWTTCWSIRWEKTISSSSSMPPTSPRTLTG